MAILPVLEIPNPILLQKAEPVSVVNDEIKQLLSDMLETMYATHGVGLAGNQVGVLKRVVVLDCADKDAEPDKTALYYEYIVKKSP